MKNLSIDIQKEDKKWRSLGFQGGLWIDPQCKVWKNNINDVNE
jgi:hypothetical protein